MIATIQHRRGTFADFDKQKMLPAEFAVVLSGDPDVPSGKALYLAFASGDVHRLISIEDLEEMVRQEVFKGDKGDPGVSVKGVDIDERGHLMITLDNGTVKDAGYIDDALARVDEAKKAASAAAQSEANSQEYESSTQHYYELTRKLSIANVGDITFSVDAERNCMVATFLEDSGEDPHDWYTRFIAFLEEYAQGVQSDLSDAGKQATAAAGSATAAAKSLADAQGVKTACDKALTDAEQAKEDAETAEGNSRTAASESKAARDEATAAADLAEQYAAETKQLSIANVGELQFAINTVRNCLTVSYTD